MLLAINANNTNTKFAIHDGSRFLTDWRIKTDPGRTADQYVVWLNQLMALSGQRMTAISGAIIATVVPQTLFHLQMMCERHLKCEPLVVGDPTLKLGIEILLDRPGEVGADRIANAIGGHVQYRSALVVVDFGTATTFDVVDGKGNYVGGAIAPGINLSLEALHASTAKLPRIAVERPRHAIGKDTLSAMQSGVFFGYVGLIEGLIERIRQEHSEPLEVIATGGLAPLFHRAAPSLQHLDPEITMRGLVEIYRRNPDFHRGA
jgi:type III pantothenate kinase